MTSPVTHDPQNDNGGLAMEFDIASTNPPPGFEEAAIGEGFLKIGVGVLRKENDEYDFFRNYALLQSAQTKAEWKKDAAQFEQICTGVNGYAYKLTAKVSVKANSLEVYCSLTNTGQKPIHTEQYSHNFLFFQDAVIGPNYMVCFPYDFDVKGLQPEQQKNGQTIAFWKAISPKVKAVHMIITPREGYQGPNEITVSNPDNGMKVRLSATLPSSRTVVHASPKHLCPEMFVQINLQPGESKEWVRRYEFELDSPAALSRPPKP